jgi:arylsulfatase A-like enzyme
MIHPFRPGIRSSASDVCPLWFNPMFRPPLQKPQWLLVLLVVGFASPPANAAALDGPAAAQPSRTATKPNVILCMADDLGWGDVGFNGNRIIKTPHLDAMAKNGLKFTRFYAQAPVCSPTRGSVLTGRHPYRYGVFSANSGHMLPAELTLAEILKANGYATGHFGKWHLGTLTKTIRDSNRGGPPGVAHFAPPSAHGFDEYFSTEAKVPTWDPLLRPRGIRRRTWWEPVNDAKDAVPYGTNYWHNGKRVTAALRGDDSRNVMDRAIPFLRSAVRRERPFFAVVWFHAPHLPVVAGPKYVAMYPGRAKYEQHYYGCITALDEQVGRLRTELRTLGVADNTLLFFCSDNGPEGRKGSAPGSAGEFRGRKRDLFEGGIRVPGLLEWPARITPGSTTDVPCVTSDYVPTVLDVLGVKPSRQPQPIDGVSLLPLIRGKMTSRPRPIGFQSGNQAALIDNRFKLVRIGPNTRPTERKKKRRKRKASVGTPQTLLFDIIADPSESKDVSARHPDVVKSMTAQLDGWQQSCRRSLEGADYSK